MRLLLQQTFLALAALTNGLAINSNDEAGMPVSNNPYEGLIPRDIILADGTKTTIYEHRAIALTYPRDPTATPAAVSNGQEEIRRAEQLAKRLSYKTYTDPKQAGNRMEYCGEANPSLTYPANAPLAADCNVIAQAYSSPVMGYWTVLASDFAAAPGGWVTLAAHGTCKFPIRIPWDPLQTVFFGTNDLRFYTRGATQYAKGGVVEAHGSVACNNNTAYVLIGVDYKLTHT